MDMMRELPPSRRGKKQIIAHLDPDLVEAVHARRRARGLTVQEIVATAVNAAAESYGRRPFLKVVRDRLVKRDKALAQVQTGARAPGCRSGKRRVAAWFDRADVERVGAFSREIGVRIEDLVEKGLRKTISRDEIDVVKRAAEPDGREAA